MASSVSSSLHLLKPSSNSILLCPSRTTNPRRRSQAPVKAASGDSNGPASNPTKLLTFLGKGGSGKTTAAVFAAQNYAMTGLRTCLVIHGQDPTADWLLNCKIGSSPVVCNDNLSAIRLQTTKMLLEPLNQLKQADAHLNVTQGVLEGVVGEELGVLPGMDSLFSALALERFAGFLRIMAQKNQHKDKFDIIVYDGVSTEETLRMIGVSSKARLYLKYFRSLAEKTDFGRLAGPSLLRLVDEAIIMNRDRTQFNGRMSAEIWDSLEQFLERGSSAVSEPNRFGCFLMINPKNQLSLHTALRYWGCAIQAGTQVSGVFGIPLPDSPVKSMEKVKKEFSPLPFAFIPHLPSGSPPDWNAIISSSASADARNLLSFPASQGKSMMPSIQFDAARKTVTLFMPGFDKSEIKLYQYRGRSELLVEAGDQRRVICLPPKIQGKVEGAKFMERSLVITMR
ncbi:hypothetical protein SLA2020_449860 [Shorea laevis]